MMRLILIAILLIPLQLFSQANQVVKGQVLDKDTELPLIGATVSIISTEVPVRTTTDFDGFFRFESVPVGRHDIIVEYLGYKPGNMTNLVLSAGKEMVLEIGLEESLIKLDEVVISADIDKSETINEFATVSSRTFSLEEVTRFSGGRNDVSRLVSNYAGVSTADDSRNDIVVRGNSPTGVLWRMEGIAIPNPNHFSTLGTTGGPVSAVNTNLLKTSDFLTSAFPAEYGNVLSGVFDLQLRSGNKDTYEGTFQLGAFSGLEAMIEGPMSSNKNSSFLISYRHSFVELANTVGIPIGTNATPNYRDLTFKLDFAKSKYGKFSLFGLMATSNIEFLANEIDETDIFAEPDADSQAESVLGIVGLKHTYLINDKTYVRTTLSANISNNEFSVFRYFDQGSENRTDFTSIDDQTNRQLASIFVNSKQSARSVLRFGVDWDVQSLNSLARDRDGNLDLDGDGLPDFETLRNIDESIFTSRVYFQSKFKFSESLTLQSGVHWVTNNYNSAGAFEPRLGLDFKLNNSNSINFGYGLHSQLAPLPFLFQQGFDAHGDIILPNKDLEYSKAHHLVLGWKRQLGSDWHSKLEVYYQSLYDIPVELESSSFSVLNFGADFGFPNAGPLVNEGTGTNYGMEYTLEKYFSKGYYALMTGSLFRSTYKGSDGIERNTAFNNVYVLNVLAGKEFKLNKHNALTLDFKFTTSGGRYFTPVDLEASKELNSEVLMDDQAFSQRYDEYLRLDFKIGFSRNNPTKKFAQQFFLDFQNLTGRQNVFANRYNRVTNEVNTLYQTGFFPDILYRLQF